MFLRQDLDELIASKSQPAISFDLPTRIAGREIHQDAIRLTNLRAHMAEHAGWRQGEIDSPLAPADSIVADQPALDDRLGCRAQSARPSE